MPHQPQPQPVSRRALHAAVSLLGDPQRLVFERCRQHILAHGEDARALLDRAAESEDPRLRLRSRALLRSLDLGQWLERVRCLELEPSGRLVLAGAARERRNAVETVAPDHHSADLPVAALSPSLALPEAPDQAGELLLGAMLLSSAGRDCSPEAADVYRWLRRVADDLRPRLIGRTATTSARILGDVMSRELGFDGNHGSYYERDNVFLDRVVAQRRGIPVALSILYLAVGRWAGLSMAGVGMPDHFLVRIHGVRPILVDPFHGARAVTKTDCLRYLRTAGYENSAADYLADLPDREVLANFVRSLLRVHDFLRDREACSAYREALAHLDVGA